MELDGENGANSDIEFAPGDVPVIDNVRPLDRKPFARTVTKFMKVSESSRYNWEGCVWQREGGLICSTLFVAMLSLIKYLSG